MLEVLEHFEILLQFSALAADRGLPVSTDDLQHLKLSKYNVNND